LDQQVNKLKTAAIATLAALTLAGCSTGTDTTEYMLEQQALVGSDEVADQATWDYAFEFMTQTMTEDYWDQACPALELYPEDTMDGFIWGFNQTTGMQAFKVWTENDLRMHAEADLSAFCDGR
jgi:hypothetical protein